MNFYHDINENLNCIYVSQKVLNSKSLVSKLEKSIRNYQFFVCQQIIIMLPRRSTVFSPNFLTHNIIIIFTILLNFYQNKWSFMNIMTLNTVFIYDTGLFAVFMYDFKFYSNFHFLISLFNFLNWSYKSPKNLLKKPKKTFKYPSLQV